MERAPGKAFERARPVTAARSVPRPYLLATETRTDTDVELPVVPGGAWLHAAVAAEARVMTPAGPRPAGSLAAGDSVLTLDDGAAAIRWVGRHALSARQIAEMPAIAPLEVPRNALTGGSPRRPLRLSPLAGMLMTLPGGPADGVLIEAGEMTGLLGIRPAPARAVTYVQFLLDRHAIVVADGLPVETFHPATLAPSPQNRRLRAEVLACFPALEHGLDLYGPEVRLRAERAR